MNKVLLLGAEHQAASSMALAYPERRFVFVTDQSVEDGWDIPNVEMLFSLPGRLLGDEKDDSIVLCPRWLPREERNALSLHATFGHLFRSGFEHLLPVQQAPGPEGTWMVKGDTFHRPDGPESGDVATLKEIKDAHGCGLVYQPQLQATAHYLAVGRRHDSGMSFGVLRVHAERFFRYDIIQAAQTVNHPFIADQSVRILEMLDYQGFFSLNWIETDAGFRLSSFRPVPKAGFRVLLTHGTDLLSPGKGLVVSRPGGCFVAQPHYACFARFPA